MLDVRVPRLPEPFCGRRTNSLRASAASPSQPRTPPSLRPRPSPPKEGPPPGPRAPRAPRLCAAHTAALQHANVVRVRGPECRTPPSRGGGAKHRWSAGAQQRAAPHLARLQCTAAVGQLGDNKIAQDRSGVTVGQRLWVGHLRRGQTTDFIMPHSSRRYLTASQEVSAPCAPVITSVTLRNTLLKHVY